MEMLVLSDVPARPIVSMRSGKADTAPPPGAFAGDVSLYDEWNERLIRLQEAMAQELDLARSGALTRARQRDGLENRIRAVHKGKSHVHVAFVEGVSEAYVRKVRSGPDSEGSG